MPWNASNLSNLRYGYDFVVAATQASINSTLLTFMNTRKEPLVNICYIADEEGDPQRIEYDELLKLTNSVDPFTIPANSKPATDPKLAALLAARFMMGFRARIGVPGGVRPEDLPDIVALGSDSTGAVEFNLLCSEFTIASLTPGGGYSTSPKWMLQSQPRGSPWTFKSHVNLSLSETKAFGTLPTEIQAQIKNLSGTAFSVQQLLFDLTNAKLMTTPTIEGVTPGTSLHTQLQQTFISGYFTQLQKEGRPLLGCAVVPQTEMGATMTLTDMDLLTCPFLDGAGQPIAHPTKEHRDLSTLCYLCAADGAKLPPLTRFAWNWVEPNEISDHHGVISINRKTLTTYFKNKLDPYVRTVCFKPEVKLTIDGLEVRPDYGLRADQTPAITMPETESLVLRYTYEEKSADRAGLGGTLARFNLDTKFELTVEFKCTTIIIKQISKIWMYLMATGISGEGHIVDKVITDTYNIGINAKGRLEAVKTSVPEDKGGKDVKVSGLEDLLTNFNDVSEGISRYAKSVVATSFKEIPLDPVQNYIFPGGQTFIFKHVAFSDTQDLVSFISYADPTRVFTVPKDA
ncbi:hypothetical protein F4825DRAFT_30417 [Nemania diffusa]|nr:hypothetical protein F4825DRAFT_30417 [Nemania diffusa]